MYKEEPIVLILDKYIINIYFKIDTNELLEENIINNLKIRTNEKEYPKDIIEEMNDIAINTKIEIFDKNNILLLSNETI